KKSLTAQLAELSNPTPIDIDPEEFGETYHTYGFDQSDEENEEVERDVGREHYVAVGKSSLRRNLFILDDPKYVGKRSSRKDIFENYSNDEDDEDDDDDDFDEEETEEKVPVKKSVRDTPAKNAQKSNQNGKDLKPSTPRSKGQESFKKQEKTPKTPKGPSSVEDIKAKMQASIEKGGSLPKVE
ncbi:hypothetical protein, partial [Acinetobacter baumannii]|uniref:hypothetical protein n=1 Tax=Acinetobacter baumannii TaxID=470 RepID=UPI003396BDC2